MDTSSIVLTIIFGVLAYFILTVFVILVTDRRDDDTPIWEVIILCIFFTPILALILEMLKPYKPTDKKD